MDLIPLQVTEASLLFVDHPVGVGFSYTDTDDDLTMTMLEDADDLLEIFKAVLQRHPGFRVSTVWPFNFSCFQEK